MRHTNQGRATESASEAKCRLATTANEPIQSSVETSLPAWNEGRGERAMEDDGKSDDGSEYGLDEVGAWCKNGVCR